MFALACILTGGLAYYFRCLHHNTGRHIMGAFRCPDCNRTFADLAEAGLLDGGGYVGPYHTGIRDGSVERAVRH